MEETNKQCPENSATNKENTCVYIKPKPISIDDHIIIKESVCNIERNKNTVVVSNKTHFKALLKKCEKLLDNDAEEITLYGLGAAVNKTCNLALQLQENHKNNLKLDIKTSTVKLYDNLIPETDEGDFLTRERLNSAINIRIYRQIPISSLKVKKQ